MKLKNTAKKVINNLIDSGYEGYLVGGSVRNFLMDKPISDIDITTNATPIEIENVFKDYKVIKTGVKHGTLTVIVDGEPVEITTYRTDSEYFDNRHPSEVKFVKSLSEDLKRRDFTINAIAYNENDGIVDLFDGISDIKNKIIRTVGNPDKRFSEDALRILRGIRFSSTLCFSVENNTKNSILKNKNLLGKISVERVLCELKKILVGDNINYVLYEFKEVFLEILPSIKFSYDKISPLISKSPKNDILRLAILLSDLTKNEAITTLKGLKCDNKTIKIVGELIENKRLKISDSKVEIKRILNLIDLDIFEYLLKFKSVIEDKNYNQVVNLYSEIINNKECYLIKHLKVDGNDIKKLGFKGNQIKEKLDYLLNEVIKESVENKKEELLNAIKNDRAII